jgi:hypothetical protein
MAGGAAYLASRGNEKQKKIAAAPPTPAIESSVQTADEAPVEGAPESRRPTAEARGSRNALPTDERLRRALPTDLGGEGAAPELAQLLSEKTLAPVSRLTAARGSERGGEPRGESSAESCRARRGTLFVARTLLRPSGCRAAEPVL